MGCVMIVAGYGLLSYDLSRGRGHERKSKSRHSLLLLVGLMSLDIKSFFSFKRLSLRPLSISTNLYQVDSAS